MKVSTFGKITASIGVAAVLASTIAGPALADPAANTYGTLVGIGSDTTQDVISSIANASNGALASYNAAPGTLSSTLVTRPGDTHTIYRGANSGAGRDSLLAAIGAIGNASISVSDGTTKPVTTADVSGYVDFARSSGGPGAAAVAGGVVTYIPFAKDAVDVAVAGSVATRFSTVPLTVGAGTDDATAPSLYRIYRGQTTFFYFNNAGTYVGSGGGTSRTIPAAMVTAGATVAYRIQPTLPRSGSGTRSFFIGQLGLKEADPLLTDYGILDSYSGTPIQEHSGTAITGLTSTTSGAETIAVGPYSVGQWVTQTNHVVDDLTAGVKLASIKDPAVVTPVSPTTGSGTSYAVNADYATDVETKKLVRDVFNIVPSRYADDPTSAIYKAFVGANSTICQATSTITNYGFLTGPTNGCGSTTNRAYAASQPTVAVSVPASAVIGATVTATATITSIGNGGGTVIFKSGTSTLATVPVAKGATTASTAITTSAVGTQAITATFSAALPGVAVGVSPAANVDITATPVVTPTVTKHTPKITIAKIKTVKLSKKGKIVVTVKGSGSTVTGTVTVKEGSKTLASKKKLSHGKVTITLPKFKKKGTHKVTVIYNGSTKFTTVKKTGVKVKVIR